MKENTQRDENAIYSEMIQCVDKHRIEYNNNQRGQSKLTDKIIFFELPLLKNLV